MKFSLTLSAMAASTAALHPRATPGSHRRQPTLHRRAGARRDQAHYQEAYSQRVAVRKSVFPDTIIHQESVSPLLSQLSAEDARSNLEEYTRFHTRYYKSQTGKQAAEWLLLKVQSAIDSAAARHGRVAASVKPFVHPNWVQTSVIATIPGRSGKTIVVGAHLDSVNQFSQSSGRSPGADDNGSGSMTILEGFKALLSDPAIAGGEAPNTIEFHWYAAEEAGLLGSQAIFAAYKKEGRDVKAMLNQDMTGYIQKTLSSGKPESLGVITDNVDKDLTAFVKKVIAAYCSIPAVDTRCGYACSDHASANKNGFPSAFVIEALMEHTSNFIHGTGDTIETISPSHMIEHAKMVVGFAYELGFTARL
ncbi:leucine aminopeptidase 1 [Drechslerella stenobrocha 248]|uniref:Peptide hydrolase n=1 Tax=Drechslerella stenobrocha 248 TaxID=1043628 RepID=W7I5H6_9PEZI|nr:leucine aminopeptidase 1 [Drechslerella stenobrocha 248]